MLSEEVIEARANLVRNKLGIQHNYSFDSLSALNNLRATAKNFSFRVGSDEELGTDEAIMDYDSDALIVRDFVLDNLRCGQGRARFTIAHELGHFFLGHRGRRARNKDKETYLTSQQKIAEIEANIFASYFLIPTELGKSASNVQELVDRFQVSISAAEIAFERIQRLNRRDSGEKRKPPAIVIDFLEEYRRRGHKIYSIPAPSES